MATDNNVIFAKLWGVGTNQFQQAFPNPTQMTMRQVSQRMFTVNNGMLYNEFMGNFVNLIGQQVVDDQTWDNPLERFIEAGDGWGASIQVSMVNWAKTHTDSYIDDDEKLLAMARPEGQTVYYTQNFQQRYKISVARNEAMMAFRDQYGFNKLINAIMAAPLTKARFDTYTAQKQLIAEHYATQGFYMHHLSAAPTDEATGKELLTALRAYVDKLYFPSTLYNGKSIEVPTFAKPGELIYITTPEYNAAVDVNTLASVFQLDKANYKMSVLVLDELPIPNAVGILTTDRFFVGKKNVDETGTFYDVSTLKQQYYYHLWMTLGTNPFVPAICFTTDEGTATGTVTMSTTGLAVSAASDTVAPGGTVQLTSTLNGTLEPTDAHGAPFEIAPDAVLWTVTAQHDASADKDGSQLEPFDLNTRTYVDRHNVLHVQKSGLETGDVLTLTAVSTYVNPSGATTPLTATATVKIA